MKNILLSLLLIIGFFVAPSQTFEFPCTDPPYHTLHDPLYTNSPSGQMQVAHYLIGIFNQLGLRQSQMNNSNEASNERMTIQTEYINNVETIVITPGAIKNNKKIIYFHGGAYSEELLVFQLEMAIDIAKRAGSPLYLVQYRLVPEHLFPAPIEDGMSVYLKLLESFNADEIVFMGDSAGGGLALGLAGKLRDDQLPMPAQLVLISPWLDVEGDNPDMPALDHLDLMLDVNQIQQGGRNYVGVNNLANLDNPYASPLLLENLGDLPPTILFIGTYEILYPDALLFKAKANAQEMDLTFITVNGGFHVWLAAPAWLVPESAWARKQVASFINCHESSERLDVDHQIDDIQLTLFPNPSNGSSSIEINIKNLNFSELGRYQIEIADISGVLHYQNDVSIDASIFRFALPLELKSGIYFVQVKNEKSSTVQTLVISQ
jgi:acetyl esterase/lipase